MNMDVVRVNCEDWLRRERSISAAGCQ